MISRRDRDPEQWIEDRDEARAHDDELDRRGTRGERALEDLTHGDNYHDWHGQAAEKSPQMRRIMAETLANARSLGQQVGA